MILYSFALASAASEPKDTRGSRGRAMGIHSLLSTSFGAPPETKPFPACNAC